MPRNTERGKKYPANKNSCNLGCGRKNNLKQCEYCEGFFCEQHLNAFETYVGHPSGRNKSVEDLENGHPCPEYAIYLEKKGKRQKERYSRALKGFLSGSSQEMEDISEEEERPKTKTIETLSLCPKCDKKDKVSALIYDKTSAGDAITPVKYYCDRCKISFDKNGVFKSIQRPKDNTEPKKIEQKEVPVKEVKVDKAISEPERIEKELPVSSSNSPNKMIAICAIGIIVLITLIMFIQHKNQSPQNVPIIEQPVVIENTTTIIQEPISINISFYTLLSDISSYVNQNLSEIGLLRKYLESSSGSGAYVNYLVDDYGNKIKLTRLSKEQQALFNNQDDRIFSVSGVIRKEYAGFYFEVYSITESFRTTELINRTVST
jgi:hypothetical protein